MILGVNVKRSGCNGPKSDMQNARHLESHFRLPALKLGPRCFSGRYNASEHSTPAGSDLGWGITPRNNAN